MASSQSEKNFVVRESTIRADAPWKIEKCWTALCEKVNEQLSFFDSNFYCANMPEDFVAKH